MSRKRKQIDQEKRGKFSDIMCILGEEIAAMFMKELKMSEEDAKRTAGLALEAIRGHAGGGALYIAKGYLHAVTETHRRIYRRFNGTNHTQLAREFDLTERQIYNIIAMVGKEEFQKRQPKLFEEGA